MYQAESEAGRAGMAYRNVGHGHSSKIVTGHGNHNAGAVARRFCSTVQGQKAP